VVRYLDEPVLANGVEKFFGFGLGSGTGIADVVGSFLAYLSAIQSFTATINLHASTHPGLAPPSR